MTAVTHLIAECNACDSLNVVDGKYPSIPIIGVLCDGQRFQFFEFDGITQPATFSTGVFPELKSDAVTDRYNNVVTSAVYSTLLSAKDFAKSFRPYCEALYYCFLLAHQRGLDTLRQSSIAEGKKEGKKRESTAIWDTAYQLATSAIRLASEGTDFSRKKEWHTAEKKAEEGIEKVQESIEKVKTLAKLPTIVFGKD